MDQSHALRQKCKPYINLIKQAGNDLVNGTFTMMVLGIGVFVLVWLLKILLITVESHREAAFLIFMLAFMWMVGFFLRKLKEDW